MKNINELPYWIALSHLSSWGNEKINNLIRKIIYEEKQNLEEFFNAPTYDWMSKFYLYEKDILDLQNAKNKLPNYSFLAEDLLSQGYEIIPINSPEYSKTLRENLKVKHLPQILYVKGNKQLLQDHSVAIVGSRNAHDISFCFTDNIAKLASKENKVVISGFAKGIDRQALDSALKYKGRSIIVLPQGIMTFGSGFKKYYSHIIEGRVTALSTFPPQSPWSVQLAMTRNLIIYGLAEEIYVAESNESGGTWAGVMDGLRKGRKIYIRAPEPKENNANNLLIEKGAIPVDFNGVSIMNHRRVPEISIEEFDENLDDKISKILQSGEYTSKQIIKKANLNWTSSKLTSYLKQKEKIEVVNKKPLRFRLRNEYFQQKLFEEGTRNDR